jgi:hypothetical protein
MISSVAGLSRKLVSQMGPAAHAPHLLASNKQGFIG